MTDFISRLLNLFKNIEFTTWKLKSYSVICNSCDGWLADWQESDLREKAHLTDEIWTSERKPNYDRITHVYAHLLADVQSEAIFPQVLLLSFDSFAPASRRMCIVSVVRGKRKKNKEIADFSILWRWFYRLHFTTRKEKQTKLNQKTICIFVALIETNINLLSKTLWQVFLKPDTLKIFRTLTV